MDIMRQSARLVVNPITVDSYGFLFNNCSVALSHGAAGWSAVCDCDIS